MKKNRYIIPYVRMVDMDSQENLLEGSVVKGGANLGNLEEGEDEEEADAKEEGVWDQVWNRSYELGSH